MHTKTAFVLLTALASTVTVGCGSSSSNRGITGTQRASLHRAKGCGDLLGDLKADATYKLDKAINRQIEAIRACVNKYGDDRCAYYGGVSYGGTGDGRAEATDASAPNASPTAPGSGGSAKSSSESATSYSQTNTQVKGVDEADIVKNDGKNLYVLHGRAFKVLNAWPSNELKEMSSIDVEGQPREMFVADGKVVVYSEVNGASVFKAANVAPKQQYAEYGFGYAGVDVARPAPPVATDPSKPAEPYVPLTKITVMRLDGTTPTVTREVYFEGSYLDSRRVGPHVRTVFQGYQYGPKLKNSVYELYPAPTAPTTTPSSDPSPKTGSQMIAALERLRAANRATIDASQLGDWLPYTFVKNGAAVSAQTVACEDFYVPTVGSTESGLTEVASLDLTDPAATPKETAILGRADTVYGNADTLYLAAHAWIEPPFMWNDPGDMPVSTGAATPGEAPAPEPAPAPPSAKTASFANNVQMRTETAQAGGAVVAWSSANTHVHKFDFRAQPDFPNYVASGTVTGTVKDQFSLDDKDGFLRIATTESRQYVTTDGKYVAADFAPPASGAPAPVRPSTANHLFVLEQKGPWLEVTGDVGDIAPNEQVYSVRFVDRRGYVVTFRQVDPLFVFDLATPSKPQLLAALKIPGFSEYMHPLDANHLLTIGRDATSTGRARGLQLKIFDVTDGAKPVERYTFTYTAQEYGSSEAEYDHKAFTFFDEKGLLAFPYYAYDSTAPGGVGMRSSLELFKVDLATGFSKLGSIDHTPLLNQSPTGYCGGYYGPSVRRGVFLENFVYSISYGGVVVKDSNDLTATGTQLALPSPQNNEGYGRPCY